MLSSLPSVPETLIDAIRSGDCIALVGAGFAGAASLPSWRALLSDLAERPELEPSLRAHVHALLGIGTAHAYDEAAQSLEDALSRAVFAAELAARLRQPALPEAMERRLRWLRGIPFRAIVTTNFDGLLTGSTPVPGAYRDVLRPEAKNPWWKGFFRTNAALDVPVLKIHGDIRSPETVVITRRDYRRLLYNNPGYQGFLRAMLANHPVLYLGFSFTDAYLNEIRSEILALLGYDGGGPVAHAIINDIPELTRGHYLRHEGIHILTYNTKGGTDFSRFDDLLGEIHDRTNPLFHFGGLLAQKRLLWVDPNPGNNVHLERFFVLSKEVAAVDRSSFHLESVTNAEDALSRLEATAASSPFDLVITHWGQNQGPTPTAVRLLEGLRRQDLRCPVIVFATRKYAGTCKPQALRLGAQAYCFTNDDLLRAIEYVLSPA